MIKKVESQSSGASRRDMKTSQSSRRSGRDWRVANVTRQTRTEFYRAFYCPVPSEAGSVAWPSPDPMAFETAESFRDAYWLAETWSKFPFELPSIDRSAVALAEFDRCEGVCAETNARIPGEYFWGSSAPPPHIRRLLAKAKAKIAVLLRDFSLDSFVPHCGWGPGASTDIRAMYAAAEIKWENSTHVTQSALPYALAYCRWACLQVQRFTVVAGNKVTTVPKNAKTERTIAIEPGWNMFLQLGVGRYLRRRLQTVGLLLRDSQERQKDRAREGSVSNLLATLDLKGASDSVALGLCEALLPEVFFRVLMALRSPVGVKPDGTETRYEKISSMGNGFTFELETLLFWALTSSIDQSATCYGDDIVCSSLDAPAVTEVLTYCGFTLNQKKSFVNGPFRESCGGHYFSGTDVTPVYVRKPLEADRRFAFANRLRHLTTSSGDFDRFSKVYDRVINGIPQGFRGPRQLGDTVLYGTFDETTPKRIYHNEFQCCYFTGKRLVRGYPAVKEEMLTTVGGLRNWLHSHDRRPYSDNHSRLRVPNLLGLDVTYGFSEDDAHDEWDREKPLLSTRSFRVREWME